MDGERVYTLYIANLAAARDVTVTGLPDGLAALRAVRTSETEDFLELPPVAAEAGAVRLSLPERCLVTLVGSHK